MLREGVYGEKFVSWGEKHKIQTYFKNWVSECE